jgi:Transglycosylase SLT domain
MPEKNASRTLMPRRAGGIIAAGLAVLNATCSWAMEDGRDICRDAAVSVSASTGVPYDVLMALSLTETGRGSSGQMQAWPWAVHFDGQGHWFNTMQEAVDFSETALANGATNIDLGCFQLNIRWHAEAFSSVADMIDPENNARYAAEYLAKLYHDKGDWAVAAGAYHSRNPENAATYRAKFEVILAELDPGAQRSLLPVSDTVAPERSNQFPLLQSGAPGGLGSIVPDRPASVRLVGG